MNYRILQGDNRQTLKTLPDASIHCVVTSPPYFGLRDYGADGQIGLEATPAEYVAEMVAVFREVWRVLRDDGQLWLNLGDSYAGSGKGRNADGSHSAGGIQATNRGTIEGKLFKTHINDGLKPKDMIGIPWRVAFALQDDGWYLRSDIIWHKPNPMPESVTDRPTKAHEYLFLLTKSERYFYDAEAIKEPNASPEQLEHNLRYAKVYEASDANADHRQPDNVNSKGIHSRPGGVGRNRRSVWTVATQPYAEAHFATYPEKLIEPCILAGTSAKGCCSACGAPWERNLEKKSNNLPVESRNGRHGHNGRPPQQSGWFWEPPTITDLGWQPTCACDAGEPVPCTVIDPFAGSGTTLAVALKHGRDAIGCELNPAYIDLIHKRISHTQPLLFTDNAAGLPKHLTGQPKDYTDTPLFAMETTC